LADELAKIRVQLGIKSAEEIAKAEKEIAMDNFERMKTGNPEYWADLQAKAGNGDMGATAATSLQGTEVGSMMAGADPVTMIIKALADFAMSIKNINKLLNPITTTIEAMRPVIEPLLNNVMKPLVDLLEMFGEVVGQIITPFASLFKVAVTLFYVIKMWVIIPLHVNKIIKELNKLPGVNIRYIDRLETSVEMLTKALRADSLIATMEYAVNKMNGLIDDQITSLQDLYEVGAISGSEYETKAASLDAQKVSLQQDLVDATVKQMNTIAELNAWIQTNMGAYLASQGVNATYGSEAASEIADKTGIKAETIAGASIGMALAGPLGAAIGIVIAPYVKDLIAKIPVVSDVVDFGSDVIGKGVDLVSDAVSYVGDKAKKFKKWLGFARSWTAYAVGNSRCPLVGMRGVDKPLTSMLLFKGRCRLRTTLQTA